MTRPRPFVVVGTQRSGSTLVASLLDSVPTIRCAEEILLEEDPPDPQSYRYFRRSALSIWSRALLSRSRCVVDYVDAFFAGAHPTLDAVGFKLMYNQLVDRRLAMVAYHHAWTVRSFYSRKLIRSLRERDVLVVHLVRPNTLEVLVSRRLAESTNVWHSREGARKERIKVTLEPKTVCNELEAIEAGTRAVDSVFAGFRCLRVSYSDVSRRPGEALQPVLCDLGVKTTGPIRTPLRKLSPQFVGDSIRNFEVVEARLAGTRFHWMTADR